MWVSIEHTWDIPVLLRFLAHVPISEHAPVLEYRHMEVN